MKLTLSKFTIIQFLSLIALLLITIHIIILGVYYYIGNPDIFDFVRMFDLDMERNIPTLFSSAIMLIAAFLFYLLSKDNMEKKKQNHLYWRGLSIVFTFLAFDESAKIHESIGDFTEKFVHFGGYLYYPWVISYGLFVIVLGLIYMRFFWRMKSNIFWSFMGSAAIYVGGAIGFELLGAHESSLHGTKTPLYSILYTIEESMEMFGVIFLIYVLLTLLENKNITFVK